MLIETDTGETPVDILNAESGASCEAAEAKALEAESAIDIEDHYVMGPGGADVKESAYVVVNKSSIQGDETEPTYADVKNPEVYDDVKMPEVYDDVKVSPTYAEVKEK